jgi:pilus assembly protein HofM
MPNSKANDTEIVTMVISTWQIGLEIQQQTLRAVAVKRQRQGWQLRQWWLIPLPENTFREGVVQAPENLIKALAQWRRELPLRHQLRVAFPTRRTLQRLVPTPDNRLCEPARESYLAASAAEQLQMLPAQLSWDYTAMPQDAAQIRVIAARHSEVRELLTNLARQRLFPVSLTPGASVLPALGRLCSPDKPRLLVHQEQDHWLWARPGEEPDWGWTDVRQAQTFSDLCRQLAVEPQEVAFSSALAEPLPQGARPLDAWRALARLQPPLPPHGGSFTVAIGLAIGWVNR